MHSDMRKYMPDPDPYTYTTNEIEEFSAHYGVDPDRVVSILRRMSEEVDKRHEKDGPQGASLRDGVRYCPHLSDALLCLPGEDALALFEEEDLDKLGEREWFIYMARTGGARLNMIEELGVSTKKFIGRQRAQQEWLLGIGHPETAYVGDTVDQYMARLHYVKVPRGFLSRAPKRAGHICRLVFTDCFYGKVKAQEEQKFLYEETVPVAGLSADDVRDLEAGRHRMLQLKFGILGELHRYLKHRSSEELWDRCLGLLTGSLTAERVDFYLRVEAVYHEPDPITREVWLPCGGLTDMLTLIGHFEEELAIGAHHSRKSWLLEPHSYPLPRESYYEAIKEGYREALDADIDRLSSLEWEAYDFKEQYSGRVLEMLGGQFSVQLNVVAKRSLAKIIERPVQAYANFLERHYETTGVVAPMVFKTDWAEQSVRLTGEEEEECEQYGYSNRSLPIEIVYQNRKDVSNFVFVGRRKVILGDKELLLFIRLIKTLYQERGGWVSKVDLVQERICTNEGQDQAIRRLRRAFATALGELKPLDFIEARRGTKTIRLSTHQALIKFNKQALLAHHDARICKLAGELPDK